MGGKKKSKCKNHIKWGLIMCKMMRGFQIWPQNSNQITCDPFLAKTLSKLVKIGYLANFRGGQMLTDLNSEARFEIK